MGKLMDTQRKIEKGVVSAYKAIENSAVAGYKKIENGVVAEYMKIENGFTDAFLSPGGDTVKGNSKEKTDREEGFQ
ncbi:MAG: hypothetical protein LBD58_12535 [Treponema sp.]|nr:hypothetical protein [Treponema sp.]